MKNNTITVRLKLQRQRIQPNERKTEINRGSTLEKILAINIENKEEKAYTVIPYFINEEYTVF